MAAEVGGTGVEEGIEMSAITEDHHPLALPDCKSCLGHGYVVEFIDYDDLEPAVLVCNCVMRQKGGEE